MPAWLDGSQQFPLRLGLLALLAAVVVGVDRLRHGAAAKRPREYGFILGWAVIGAVVGAAFDAVTSRIGPDYFVHWKGIAPGAGFEQRVLALGARAGFGLGIFVAALLAFANTRRDQPPIEGWRALSQRAARVIASALLFAALLGGVAFLLELPAPSGVVPLSGRPARVWWIHLGVYLGALGGTSFEVARLRRHAAGQRRGEHPSVAAP